MSSNMWSSLPSESPEDRGDSPLAGWYPCCTQGMPLSSAIVALQAINLILQLCRYSACSATAGHRPSMQHLLQTWTAASPAPKASSAILQGLPCTNTTLVTLGDGTQGLLSGSLHCRAFMCNRCTASACLCQAPPLRLRRCSASLQASRPSMAGAVSGEGCFQGIHSPLNMGRKAPCCSVLAPCGDEDAQPQHHLS